MTRLDVLNPAMAGVKDLSLRVSGLLRPPRGAPYPPEDPCIRQRREEINGLLGGYPRNHSYRVSEARLIPSWRLYQRLRAIRKAYPQPLESFLDIGCCRGFYVLEASQRPTCRMSAGIDVHPPFVSTAEDVRQHLRVQNAAFHLAALQDVAEHPEAYGGPFQTVLLVGTYHYLFWGSEFCATGCHSHREILRRVARLCTDRCILSARLELNQLPAGVRELAERHPDRIDYTTKEFLSIAQEFFRVERRGSLGIYPLFVLHRKNNSE